MLRVELMRVRVLTIVALLAAASASAAETNLTGKWTLHVKFFLGSGDPWFQFEQSGEKLTGMYHGRFGDLPLAGTVKGDQVTFTIEDKRGAATYQGTVTGDTMKGTAKYPRPAGTGHFEGKRTK